MKQHQGVWFPDHEQHLLDWMTKSGEIVDGRGTYQIKKLRTALSFCRNFRTAVDVGAHIGLWSMQLVKQFKTVHAFEPVEAHRDCFQLNVIERDLIDIGYPRAVLHECALGDHDGSVQIETAPTSSGDSKVGGDGDIPLRTLDSFNLRDVDFIKLDCEGYEYFALRGGEQTIRRNLPTIIVEQKPGRGQHFGLRERQAVEWLQRELGYELVTEMAGDFVMVPG